MSEITSRLKQWKEGDERPPFIAQVHFTNRCNLSCDFCPTVASKEKGEIDLSNELDKDRWLEIIGEGNGMGIEEWHVCGGGEPLFEKETALDLMEEMKKGGSRGEIITNGTILGKDGASRIVEMDWDLVTFSLDGPNKRTNDAIRSEGSFEKVIRNAKLLSKLRNESEPFLRIHTVVCNKNYDKLAEMVELTNRIGFDEIRFNSMNVWNEAGEELKLDSKHVKDARENLRKAEEIAREVEVDTNVDEFLEHNLLEHANEIDQAMKNTSKELEGQTNFENISCYYPWYNISIFAGGGAAPCFLFHDGVSIKDKSIKKVWYGNFFDDVRKRFLNDDLKDECKNCNAWNVKKMEEIRDELNG